MSAVLTPLRAAAVLLVGLFQVPAVTAPQPRDEDAVRLRATLPVLRKNLEEAVVRFWYPRVVDRVHGGYRVAFDADGKPSADGSKMIVTQARMLWLFSRLARAGQRAPEMREAAAHGYRFLVDRMRDPQHGGYFWEVDETASADLVVLGTHGRGPVAHMLMGSVAERVVRTAPCPVLTVRHPQHEFVSEGLVEVEAEQAEPVA